MRRRSTGRNGEPGRPQFLAFDHWWTDQPADFQRLSTVFAAFSFKLEPVLDIGDAVATEAAAIAWRDGLNVR